MKIKKGIKKGHWSKDEDDIIIECVIKLGTKWSSISKIMINRNGKQIRDRYLNYLDTNINREKFSEEEDKLIQEKYKKYGSKWTKISKYLERRTPEMIKNRFYSFLKSKIHIYEIPNFFLKRKKFNILKKLQFKNHDQNNSFILDDDLEPNDLISQQLKKENIIELMYIKNINPLHVCSEDNFSYCGSNKSFSLENGDQNIIPNFKEEDIKMKDLEKYLENPLNLKKFLYYYLENSKTLLNNRIRKSDN